MCYRRDSQNTPRLAGTLLKCVNALAAAPVLGFLVRHKLLAASNIPGFRAAGATEAPIITPPLPRGGGAALGFKPDGATDGVRENSAASPEASKARPWAGAAQFTEAYREGALDPQDVTEAFLDAARQADRLTPPLRAFIAIDEQDLRAQARESSRRWRQHTPLGPLDGVPVAVKDELDQVPYPTTAGTSFLGGKPASSDAAVVERLRAAGALLVGKANMHEVGLGVTGVNPHHGTTRNPHDPSRVTGGSSGGAAAAVAAGLCPIAIGADAGGSIRIPSAFCGVIGLKPTFGRVSERGATPLCWSLAHIGPIGASARDVALAYLAIAGIDPADPNTHDQPAPHLRAFRDANLAGLTIGVFRPWFEDADAEVVAACQGMLDVLSDLGARVCEVIIPDLHLVRPVHSVTAAVEWAEALAQQYDRDPRVFGHDVRLLLQLARSLGATDYLHAQRLRRRISSQFEAVLKEVDVVITPTTATPAPPVPLDALSTGESDLVRLEQLTRFVTVSNLTGLPAISLPAGYDATGLPIGSQLIARPWHEDVLLRVAAAVESLREHRVPRVHFRLLDGLRV